MILEDFVMLGKTVPECNSDGRQFVCTAGYSLELRQAIRIYPMARQDCPRRWSVSCVPLERNHKDSRRESWKIRGDRSPDAHNAINQVITPVLDKIGTLIQREIIDALTMPSIDAANKAKISLCVLFPADLPRIDLRAGEVPEMEPTPDMFGNAPGLPVLQRFRWHPRVRFIDREGFKHDLQLRDWGCYELMRKHGDEYALQLGDILKLSPDTPLFCGNINRHRNVWLIISVFGKHESAKQKAPDQQFNLFSQEAA